MALQMQQGNQNGILFDFYTGGLPHNAVYLSIYKASFPGSPC